MFAPKLSRLGSRSSDAFVLSSVLLTSICCDCVKIISSLADGCMLGRSGRDWGIWILRVYKEEDLLEEEEHHPSLLDILI